MEAALDKAERQAAEDTTKQEGQPSEGAGVAPCENQPEGSNIQLQEEDA